MEKRNIVLITLDSLRADHCSFMGYHRKTTPTMDKMARKGVYFENAIVKTLPTAPSMYSIFTGEEYIFPNIGMGFESKVWMSLLSKKRTLAEELSSLGYFTASVNPNPWVSRICGYDKGFEYYYDFLELYNIKILSKYTSYKLFTSWNYIYDKINNITKLLSSKRPYFLWVLVLDTHYPYIPKFKIYSKNNIFKTFFLNWKVRRHDRVFRGSNLKYFCKLAPSEISSLIDLYDDCIYSSDVFLSKLWDLLRDDDPIFIIHGDHGEGFGEHGFFYHPARLYEELIHVPLVVYNSDLDINKVTWPVSLSRLLSLIMRLTGLESRSFSRKDILEPVEYVVSTVSENGFKRYSVRTTRWKYIVDALGNVELYDLRNDPYERENLYSEHSDLVRYFSGIVRRHKLTEALRKATNIRGVV